MAAEPPSFYCLWQDRHVREILFELLSKEDLCNVRLASSACCNLVTKRLFLRTHITFSANTFTRQSRIQALSRIGQHIEHLTFYFPHSEATFLPPLIHPETGREVSFLYKPHTSIASVLERPKFAHSGLGELLTRQYPPLFHAATNVPSFINAMRHLRNMRHLTIKTPGQDPQERYRRDIVDYALISLRISIERTPMDKLSKLTLSSVHASAFIYLRHVTGFGCLPSAGRRWRQIRKMHITAEAWDFYGPSPGLDHLKMMEDYIRSFSSTLEKFTFTWIGRKGPCPLSLAEDPLFSPPRSSQKLFHEVTSPMSPLPPAPARKPIIFNKLRYLAVRNATMNAPQVADLVDTHQHSVREFDFENVVLINSGSWDEALAPLMDSSSRSEHWSRYSSATISDIASQPSTEPIDDLSEPSAAVVALSDDFLKIDLYAGADDSEVECDEDDDDDDGGLDLPSDVEAARKASLSFANKLKKRRVTKRRRRRKPSHERHEEVEDQQQWRFQQEPNWLGRRDRSRQPSKDSITRQKVPPRLYIPSPLSGQRGFREVDSITSTVSSRRLFGEVTQISSPTTEPELTFSPTDDSSSLTEEFYRPATPVTPKFSPPTPKFAPPTPKMTPPSPKMKISSPIFDREPNMPTLLQPTVYDPTAQLCSEISAVQRDIEAEEAQRLVAEDVEMQFSALRRAKERVLSRLGREFHNTKRSNGGGLSPRKENFGPPSFLSSTRFREGLFGKSTTVINNVPTRGLTRYLHASPSWALVTGASDGIGLALASELAATGFNVVLHGRSPSKLATARARLERTHPSRSFRVLVADATDPALYTSDAEFHARVLGPLADLRLTVVINNAGAGPTPTFGPLGSYPRAAVLDTLRLNAAFPALVSAALVPRLAAPALLLNIASVTDEGLPLLSFYGAAKACAHVLHVALAQETRGRGVEVLSHRVGAVTGVSRVREPPSWFRPDAKVLARAVLARTGCGRGVVVPYWPHALQQVGLGMLPGWVRERIVGRVMWESYRRQEEGK
ncbi:hypothetical protein F4810DRAFT_722628 [Camillea tinctor]|nr:hypothetical protein F4810DRAFT_722628 [Camillea tinctor]